MFEEEELDAGVAWQLSVDRSVRRRLGRNTGLTAGLFLVFQFFFLFFFLVSEEGLISSFIQSLQQLIIGHLWH